jgi:hypothetical protein
LWRNQWVPEDKWTSERTDEVGGSWLGGVPTQLSFFCVLLFHSLSLGGSTFWGIAGAQMPSAQNHCYCWIQLRPSSAFRYIFLVSSNLWQFLVIQDGCINWHCHQLKIPDQE